MHGADKPFIGELPKPMEYLHGSKGSGAGFLIPEGGLGAGIFDIDAIQNMYICTNNEISEKPLKN